MWATASRKLVVDPPFSFFPLDASANTKLDTTGLGWLRNLSRVERHENILCGSVPPMTVSLLPIASMTMPTSPMAPH